MENKTYKAIKAILLNYRLINPELVSDGYGEFPDAYRMKDTDAEDIATEIININKTERKCEYCLGTGIIENGEECEECDGLGKVWLEESEQEQGDERKCETCIRHTSNPRINGLPQCYAHGIDANLCVQYIPIPQRPTCPDAIINPTKLRQILLEIFHHNMGDFKIEHYAKLIEDSFVPTEQPTKKDYLQRYKDMTNSREFEEAYLNKPSCEQPNNTRELSAEEIIKISEKYANEYGGSMFDLAYKSFRAGIEYIIKNRKE